MRLMSWRRLLLCTVSTRRAKRPSERATDVARRYLASRFLADSPLSSGKDLSIFLLYSTLLYSILVACQCRHRSSSRRAATTTTERERFLSFFSLSSLFLFCYVQSASTGAGGSGRHSSISSFPSLLPMLLLTQCPALSLSLSLFSRLPSLPLSSSASSSFIFYFFSSLLFFAVFGSEEEEKEEEEEEEE